jgi:hypothetical protein
MLRSNDYTARGWCGALARDYTPAQKYDCFVSKLGCVVVEPYATETKSVVCMRFYLWKLAMRKIDDLLITVKSDLIWGLDASFPKPITKFRSACIYYFIKVLLSWSVSSKRKHIKDFMFAMGVPTEMRYDRASQYGCTKFIDPRKLFLESRPRQRITHPRAPSPPGPRRPVPSGFSFIGPRIRRVRPYRWGA